MRKYSLIFFSVFVALFNGAAYADELSDEIQYKEQVVQKLKEEIAQIDSEMARCNKAKKGWVAATVVGGIGVAATGTAAIVQTVQNKKNTTKQDTKGAE